jgi:peptidoglycan/LPS O-acetylase OafA/YrhL
MSTFDNEQLFPKSHSFANLILSNTFISPKLVNSIFLTQLDYIDGAYWTLWVEVVFYFVIGFLYFSNKNKLLRNFSIFSFIATIIYFIFTSHALGAIVERNIGNTLFLVGKSFVEIFDIFGLSIWFLLGILLYNLYLSKSRKHFLLFTFIYFIQIVLTVRGIPNMIYMIINYILLIIFIFKPDKIAVLGNPIVSRLGVISYSVYLIHASVGILIINKLSPVFGIYNWLIGIILTIFFFIAGLYSYKYIERPLGNVLKKKLDGGYKNYKERLR